MCRISALAKNQYAINEHKEMAFGIFVALQLQSVYDRGQPEKGDESWRMTDKTWASVL